MEAYVNSIQEVTGGSLCTRWYNTMYIISTSRGKYITNNKTDFVAVKGGKIKFRYEGTTADKTTMKWIHAMK